MIGVLDSGVGGFNSLPAIRRALPLVDIVYLADRRNAPYGIRGRGELITIVSEGIDRLLQRGAERVLLACCTASTVWSELDSAYKAKSMPIIGCVEKAVFGNEETILVIATERTVKDGAFGRVIKKESPDTDIVEIAMQSLVLAVEKGAKEGNLRKATYTEIERIKELFRKLCPDAIVLGCTHFSSVAGLICEAIPDVRIINTANLGGEAMANELLASGLNVRESGKIIYM